MHFVRPQTGYPGLSLIHLTLNKVGHTYLLRLKVILLYFIFLICPYFHKHARPVTAAPHPRPSTTRHPPPTMKDTGTPNSTPANTQVQIHKSSLQDPKRPQNWQLDSKHQVDKK